MGERRGHRLGRKFFIAAALGPICAVAADLPVREVTSLAAFAGNAPSPAFQRGYMYFLDNGAVRVYTPQGHPAFVRVLSVPGATDLTLDSLAVDSDGSVAIAVSYKAAQAGGIVLLDKNGLDTGFIDTGRWLPSNLSYGEDHSLWSFGWQHDAANPEKVDRRDYMMVRHYGAGHSETESYLARSLFPKGMEPGMPSWQNQRIMFSHDKIGLLAYSGRVGSSMEWVELDLNGNLIRRVPITDVDIGNDGAAFTSDGHFYWKDKHSDRLMLLSGSASDWLDAGPSPGRWLMGADGDLLVFARRDRGPADLQWFAQPTSKAP